MKKLHQLVNLIVGWLLIAAIGLSAYIAYLVLLKKPSNIIEGRQLVSRFCGRQNSGKLTMATHSGSRIIVHYDSSGKGCNSISGNNPATIEASMSRSRAALLGMGLRPVPEPLDIYIGNNLKNPVSALPPLTVSKDKRRRVSFSGRGITLLDSSQLGDLNSMTDQAYAELSLARSSPGLDLRSRARVAGAYAILSTGDDSESDSFYRRQLSRYLESGGKTNSSGLGFYEAWLVSGYGIDLLRTALSQCRHSCSWSDTLDTQLRRRGARPRSLKLRFARKMTASPARQRLLVRSLS